MFVNIPSRIVEIQQYFTPIFSTSLVCACCKYEFMCLADILRSFFRLNVEILAEFVFILFEPFLSRVFRLNFNLNYCLCILDYGNGLPLYVPDILKISTTFG